MIGAKRLAAKRRRGIGHARLIVAIERESAHHANKSKAIEHATEKMIKPGEQAIRRDLQRRGRDHDHVVRVLGEAVRCLHRAPPL